jgi:hypothetical protein
VYEVGPNVKLIPTTGGASLAFQAFRRSGPRHDVATLNQFIEFKEAKIFGSCKTPSIGHQTAHNYPPRCRLAILRESEEPINQIRWQF